jgi:hypothetical protein
VIPDGRILGLSGIVPTWVSQGTSTESERSTLQPRLRATAAIASARAAPELIRGLRDGLQVLFRDKAQFSDLLGPRRPEVEFFRRILVEMRSGGCAV